MHTPFFPLWRARLAPLGRRVHGLRQQSLACLDQLFGPLLPPQFLSQADEGSNSRARVFSVRRTFFGFLYQVLNPDCPCREVVRQIQALFALHHDDPVAPGSSAYCQARARLPWDILPRLRCAAAAQAQKAAALWRGLSVKVIDGTSVSLPDTVKNQRAYPQTRSQKPGCGFPLLKLVGVFSLSTGALLDYAQGHKGQHELTLLQKLLDQFKPGDLALADRGFSAYTLLGLLSLRGARGLFRLHHARPADFRRGKRLGRQDRLLVWPKPQPWQRPPYLSKSIWKLIPQQLSVRLVRFTMAVPGFRSQSVTLVTTLLDAQAYPAQELARLYARRWQIELWFRDLKTSMGLEVLRCKSPGMLHKELEMFFIAYNLVRCLMAQAGTLYDAPLERLSFKGTVDSVRQFSLAIAQARSGQKQKQLLIRLLENIAQDHVPDRAGRSEPRAVKRRPKPYPLLNRPRRLFQEIPHRNRYWKNNPRKIRA
jgi:Transposase DDE domain